MERLIFVCPKTLRPVDVGIETDINTLLRIRGQRVGDRCRQCGERHEWPVGDAFLAEAA